eukprot:GFUD01037323.1.p1 GENE.GFUD01037323.1~~GFUD01037323.1.p1  ORF type:complete len:374 (+),score=49.69 GFUD01037323.1:204-1325(+)
MAVKISPNSQTFPFLEEHSDNSYKYVKSSGTGSPSSNKCNTHTSNGLAVAKTDNESRRRKSNSDKTDTSSCRTLPYGEDLDQVIVGTGRFEHRQLFEKAYRVGNLIGRGGFGSVYAGVRLKDNKIVAIKHVARDNIRLWCSAHGKSVPKEICLMRHAHGTPNVIKLLDFYERPDSFILILSRPSCYKDLFDFISEKGTLDEVISQKFFKQILAAVKTLKEKNVIHRDIKDENILVNLKTNNCILIDFGSGCHLGNGTLREFEGTHLYAPPEWLQKGEYSGEAATVWSLGVLLFVMINGDVPFQSDQDICKGDLRFRKHFSIAAKELIKECLQMDPADRLTLDEVSDHPWCKQDFTTIKSTPRPRKYSSTRNVN